MLQTMLSIFTGSSKWVYIALAVLALTCISLGSLSISLYGDKQALHVKVQSAKEALEKLEKEHKELSEALAKRNADIQTQNALIEQNRVDFVAKEKAFKEALAKKPKIVTDIKYIPTNTNECNDLQNIIDEYIATGAQQ